MISTRKDQHVKYALEENVETNDFDSIILKHNSLPELDMNEVNLKTTIFSKEFNYPFYINAMTGGSENTLLINKKLAFIAKEFDLPFVLGSQSAALKDETLINTYKVVREIYPEAFIIGNVSANATLIEAKRAIEMVDADALSIHVNVIQELVMTEGDREFKHWTNNIKDIVDNLSIPVIVKEVGFGMSTETIKKLENINVKYIDVSGKGGTNFARIERKRSGVNDFLLEEIGISTVDSLYNAKDYNGFIYASGGIRSALDIYKALRLGASAVGLSGYFLRLTTLTQNEAITEVKKLIENLKKCYVIFGAI